MTRRDRGKLKQDLHNWLQGCVYDVGAYPEDYDKVKLRGQLENILKRYALPEHSIYFYYAPKWELVLWIRFPLRDEMLYGRIFWYNYSVVNSSFNSFFDVQWMNELNVVLSQK